MAAGDVSTYPQIQDVGAYQAVPYTYVRVFTLVVKAHMYIDTRRNTQRLQSKLVLISNIGPVHRQAGHKSCMQVDPGPSACPCQLPLSSGASFNLHALHLPYINSTASKLLEP